MAEVKTKSYARLWPFAFALVGVAGLVYAGIRMLGAPKEDLAIDEAPSAPVVDPGPDEHFETVRTELLDEYTEFPGKVGAESVILVSTIDDARMKVPIEHFHKETGDVVKKGDVVVSFNKTQIENAIKKAKSEGRTDDAARFQTYLDNADLKAPSDGVILEFKRDLGETPIPGLGVFSMTDLAGFRFTVNVPATVQAHEMTLSKKYEVDLGDLGKVMGTVTQFKEQVGDEAPVVLALEAHPGLEPGLAGTIRVPTGKKEAGLVPKTAVLSRGGVPYVRVWDAESKSITEKTVKTGAESGPDVIILAGVFPGDSVVVPGKARN